MVGRPAPSLHVKISLLVAVCMLFLCTTAEVFNLDRVFCYGPLPDGPYGDTDEVYEILDTKVNVPPTWGPENFTDLENLCSSLGNRYGNYGGTCQTEMMDVSSYYRSFMRGRGYPHPSRSLIWDLELARRALLYDDQTFQHCKDNCLCVDNIDEYIQADLRLAASRYDIDPSFLEDWAPEDWPSEDDEEGRPSMVDRLRDRVGRGGRAEVVGGAQRRRRRAQTGYGCRATARRAVPLSCGLQAMGTFSKLSGK